jgi:hypothetical protein
VPLIVLMVQDEGSKHKKGASTAWRGTRRSRSSRHRKFEEARAMMFDYTAAALRVGIPGDKLERLVILASAEFPDDETLAELHILRAILAVERGDASLEEILRQEVAG